jgi:hypothetical protein
LKGEWGDGVLRIVNFNAELKLTRNISKYLKTTRIEGFGETEIWKTESTNCGGRRTAHPSSSCRSLTQSAILLKNPTQRRQGPARPAATKEFEQEQTEKTEAEKFCQKCATFRYSTARKEKPLRLGGFA